MINTINSQAEWLAVEETQASRERWDEELAMAKITTFVAAPLITFAALMVPMSPLFFCIARGACLSGNFS
jgi:hypothetical protein